MKTFTFLCLGMLMATMALAQGPVITVYPASLQEGLYTGDSLTRPVTVSNSGTTDLSCTITVEPTSATGSVNNALKFDGVNDYGMVYNTPALRLTSQLTIEAWINFEA